MFACVSKLNHLITSHDSFWYQTNILALNASFLLSSCCLFVGQHDVVVDVFRAFGFFTLWNSKIIQWKSLLKIHPGFQPLFCYHGYCPMHPASLFRGGALWVELVHGIEVGGALLSFSSKNSTFSESFCIFYHFCVDSEPHGRGKHGWTSFLEELNCYQFYVMEL